MDATLADIRTRGLRSARQHIPALERELSDAGAAYAVAEAPGETKYVLVDGMAETLGGLLKGAEEKRKTIAVKSPYPPISLVLASYYNEVNLPADALRVLDAGLALPQQIGDAKLGMHLPLLVSERGVALGRLKRWPEALANYQTGLALPALMDRDRARMLRGRGVILVELKRLDEAEAAFNDSLKVEPKNSIAVNELRYIAELRRGRPAVNGQMTMPNLPADVPR
ncbi:MAG: tetratricopeptide repeat protein [Magnetospirillum sp.]|nr:tetratricopeptide repeat protein [Magnetospirillum sp.]